MSGDPLDPASVAFRLYVAEELCGVAPISFGVLERFEHTI